MLSHLLQQAQWDWVLNLKALYSEIWLEHHGHRVRLISLSACSGNAKRERTARQVEQKRSHCFVCKWLRINACRGVWNANGLDYCTHKPCSDETTCRPVNMFAVIFPLNWIEFQLHQSMCLYQSSVKSDQMLDCSWLLIMVKVAAYWS